MEWKHAHQTLPDSSEEEMLILPNKENPNGISSADGRAFKRPAFPYMLVGLMLAILIGLFIVRFPGNRAQQKRLAAHEKRLQQLEQQTGRMQSLAEDLAQLAEKATGLSRALNLATIRINRIDAGLAELRKTTAALRRRAVNPTVAPAVATQRAARTFHHRVQPGETLYSISRHYGTTVQKLRRANRLGSRQLIHPGQRLKIIR